MKHLVAYITAGFPHITFTKELILAMSQHGVDKIELGYPFSDPMADGAVIAHSHLQSLKNGFTYHHILDIAHHVSHKIETYIMGYINPFYRIGIQKVFNDFKNNGIKGVIIPDIPYEESSPYIQAAKAYHLSFIPFIAPTTLPQRMSLLIQNTSPFIYFIAYSGITGSLKQQNLTSNIQNLRKQTNTPIYIGFGVEQNNAKEKSQHVDGVIVGTAFIRILLQQDLTNAQKIAKICHLASSIKEAIN